MFVVWKNDSYSNSLVTERNFKSVKMEPGGANPPEEEHNQNENDPHPEKVKSKLGIHICKPLNFLYGYIENSFLNIPS